MKILFLGYAVGMEEAKDLTGVSIAGNKMQLNVLWNLKQYAEEMESITIYPVAVFPKDKKMFIKEKEIDLGNNMKSRVVPFLNIPFIKQISQIISMYYVTRKYIKKSPDTIVLAFNMYPQIGTPARWLKKKYHCKIVSLLADLPIDDDYGRKGLAKLLRTVFDGQTKRNILEADKVIVLNKYARELFAPNIPYLVVDGGINLSEFDCSSDRLQYENREKNIVYCGSLAGYSGVKELVKCLEKVKDQSIVLDIYGKGTLEGYINSKKSERIRYHGSVTNQEMLQIQKSAWLLVNPRPVDDLIAQVTFPSKIFEYMMSGTPVLTTKLNGFSEAYEGKVFFANNNSTDELAKCINEISKLSNEELKKIAKDAKDFLMKEKTWEKQTEKIASFIN